MDQNGSKTRRRSFRWLRISVAFILIISINFAGFLAWNKYLPWVKLAPYSKNVEKEVKAEEIQIEVVKASEPWTGQEAINMALKVFPDLDESWKDFGITRNTLGNVLESSCEKSGFYAPVMQGQRSWRLASEVTTKTSSSSSSSYTRKASIEDQRNSGVVAQIRIYPAGLGAVAYKQLKYQALSCYGDDNWSIRYTGDVPIGVEGFGFEAKAERSKQDNIIFRYGDIIGIVSARGYNGIDSLASDWALRWNNLLGSACKDFKSTENDASRQPLYKKYDGYLEERKYELPLGIKTEVEQQVAASVKSGKILGAADNVDAATGEATNIINVPVAPRIEAGEELILEDVPLTNIRVNDMPKQPKVPVFPEPVEEAPNAVSIKGPSADIVGPGCGWALTGQSQPPFDSVKAAEEWGKLQQGAVEELSRQYADWVLATWEYASKYDAYVKQVEAWNSWVKEATYAIAKAEWADYDKRTESYQQDKIQYESAMEDWNVCKESTIYSPESPTGTSENSTTTTQVTPDSQDIPIASCGAPPIEPIMVNEPYWPRPSAYSNDAETYNQQLISEGFKKE